MEQTEVYKDNKIYLDSSYLDVLKRVMSIESETKILYADNKRLWAEIKELREDTNKQFKELREDTNKQIQELRENTDNKFLEIQKQSNKYFTILFIAMGVFSTIITGIIYFSFLFL